MRFQYTPEVDELDRWHPSCTVRSGLVNQPINRLIHRWLIRAGTSTAPRSTHSSGTTGTLARTHYTRFYRSPRDCTVGLRTCCRWLCRADSRRNRTDRYAPKSTMAQRRVQITLIKVRVGQRMENIGEGEMRCNWDRTKAIAIGIKQDKVQIGSWVTAG